ncbi:MAG: sulfite exporter TauE/SafE family protein [Brachymonas sp.]|nr:sulfite exporter TauE/SafE family protein [Brachymonas sp.]
MPPIEYLLLFAALGCVVGFMAGLLGIGGGGIAVPSLTALFLSMGVAKGEVVHLALGTSMAAMIVTAFSSMRSHSKRGNVLVPIVKALAPGIIVGTFAATFLAAKLPARALAIFFAAFMAFAAFQMFRGTPPGDGSRQLLPAPWLFGGGLLIGAVSALVSIGGGSLTVPFLNWQSVDIRKAIGTSSAVGFPIAIAGTVGYAINGAMAAGQASSQPLTAGFVYLPAALLLASGSFFMAPVGATVAQKMQVAPLKRLFGLLLLGLSLRMLFSVL